MFQQSRFTHFFIGILIPVLYLSCKPNAQIPPAIADLDPVAGISEAQLDTLSKYLTTFPNKSQVAIGIINDSTLSSIGVFRQKDTLRTFTNADSVFEIGSISKVFTSTLLAQQFAAGKMAPDDQVTDYLSFSLKNDPPITLLQLSNHTSGLPRIPGNMLWSAIFNQDNPYKDYVLEDMQSYLEDDLELEAQPGSEYGYSNLGAGLLGYVLTEHTGKNYEQLLQDSIFIPLNMDYSTTHREKVRNRLVPGRNTNGHITENWDLGVLAGAGGILSTVNDLSHFAFANLYKTDTALIIQQQKTFSVGNKMDIAMGWHLIKRYSGHTWHWHNGGTGGYSSSMGLNLQRKDGVIILSNISAGHPDRGKLDNLCYALLLSLANEN